MEQKSIDVLQFIEELAANSLQRAQILSRFAQLYKCKKSYYENLHFRDNYNAIDYARSVPFLCMLPMALNTK